MLSTVLENLSDLVTCVLTGMSGIVVLWPVSIMAGFLVLGVGISAIKKLAGGKKSKKRRRA